MFKAPYTDTEIEEHAKQFNTRAEWNAAGEVERQSGNPSHFGCATKRGREFMCRCCAHMQHGTIGNRNGIKYSDQELVDSAKPFQHKSDWKEGDKLRYNMAILRPDVFKQATAHMIPKASPYSGSYVIYAYEFTDRRAYVGLTFRPKVRHWQHMRTGPVFEHLKVCSTYVHKVVEENLASPTGAAAAEKRWIERYTSSGWMMLNGSAAGSLGTVNIGKWTKEAVLAKAREFQTRKAWYLGSQFTYGLAKREGWFEEAAAHMPRRVLGVGKGRKVSAETREKQRQAKLGTTQTASHRRNRSAAVREWWADRS